MFVFVVLRRAFGKAPCFTIKIVDLNGLAPAAEAASRRNGKKQLISEVTVKLSNLIFIIPYDEFRHAFCYGFPTAFVADTLMFPNVNCSFIR
ncbi:MAG: hypothetical protein Q4G07_10400, partial [Oscillospiraceae bacterium]|nr:hypothetical protein [Oscillospiraceae bacterium]